VPPSEPAWWYAPPGDPRARALAPLGRLYGWVAERRYRRAEAYRSPLPVLCIGNFTAGGTGKTPLGLLVADIARSRGLAPAFLSRGYGGTAAGPLLVDPGMTSAALCGDEPLLLARSAPTVVARDRAAGARYIAANCHGTGLIVMDDGLQNGSLAKDVTIAVVDGTRGLGNGEIIPAGPLRAPMPFQLDLVDAIVVNEPPATGAGTSNVLEGLRRRFDGPVLSARVAPSVDTAWLRERRVVAFAGIGHPQRFFDTLRDLGAELISAATFADHHVFTEADAQRLLASRDAGDAMLVTTEKDLARLTPSAGNAARTPALAALQSAARALPVRLALDESNLERLTALIDGAAHRPR
jgi:tetraacyldisaccharide 4'-kinase